MRTVFAHRPRFARLVHFASPPRRTAMSENAKFPGPKFLDEIAAKVGEVLKQSPAKDIEKNLKAGVASVLTRLDMVSREEFDVQAEVLARTREKLKELETRIAELEKRLVSEED
jgi:BMFP domain-containing protein YqiC